MSIQVEKITPPISLGEGPHWDFDSNTLYFIDQNLATVHSYKPDSGKYNTAKICNGEIKPTFIIPVEGQNGRFVISNAHDVCVMDWDGVSEDIQTPNTIASCEPKDNPTRLNDGKADPAGRLWTGSMGFEIEGELGEFIPERGGLYSITRNNSKGYKVNQHLDKITLSNGLGWSLDQKTFYYIDSMKYQVSSYDYDIKSGSISNRRTVLDFKQKQIPGIPDGMTVDSEGKLLVAVFGGGCVLRIDPESGEVLTKVPVPCPQVTSITFGGDNFDELYVTTANIYSTPETIQMFPDAGSVYKITNLGFKGVKANNVRL